MTRGIWLTLIAIAITLITTVAASAYNFGVLDQEVANNKETLVRHDIEVKKVPVVEERTRIMLEQLSRIEGKVDEIN